jgi:tyrosyl-tRNA synthetase
MRQEQPNAQTTTTGSIIDALVGSGLAASNTEARRLLAGNAVSVNNQKVTRETFVAEDFVNGHLLLRKGKKFKDTALIELQN